MSTTAEGSFKRGNVTLYTKTWTPTCTVKAKLVFVHGFSEHINRYDTFFAGLNEHGIEVCSWDQRGWGRSVMKASHKGLTGPTSEVVADIAAFIEDQLPSAGPIFVMGHSMGGGEILTLAGDVTYDRVVSQVRGWILEGAFIGFAPDEEPSSLKIFLGRLVGRILPKQQLKHVVPPEHLSRDPAVVESIRKDPLCHNTGTLEGLAGLLDRATALSSGRVKLGKNVRSVLLAHGQSDLTCSADAAVQFLEQQLVEDKTVKLYEGAYHQLHSDSCKDEFSKDLVTWILARCNNEQDSTIGSKL